MWILWIGTLLFVRYGVHTMFHRFTSHRGIWHSLIAGLVCALATVIIFYYVFDRPDGVAWLGGGFLLIGFLTHLILDEMYSVDVLGNHIKRSFGTAFKPIDMRNPAGSVAMAVAAVALLFLTPSITVFYDGITSRPMWASLHQRLLPQDNWFGVMVDRQVATKHRLQAMRCHRPLARCPPPAADERNPRRHSTALRPAAPLLARRRCRAALLQAGEIGRDQIVD